MKFSNDTYKYLKEIIENTKMFHASTKRTPIFIIHKAKLDNLVQKIAMTLEEISFVMQAAENEKKGDIQNERNRTHL